MYLQSNMSVPRTGEGRGHQMQKAWLSSSMAYSQLSQRKAIFFSVKGKKNYAQVSKNPQ